MRTAQHLLHALHLMLPADERIEMVFHRRLAEIAAELGQQRRLLHPGQRRFFVQQLNDILTHGVQPHPLLHQDRCGDGALFPQDAEQQMLGPDVVVQQTVGFLGRKLEHALRFSAERNFNRGRDFFPKNRAAFDFLADVFERQMRTREDAACKSFAFAD
jgi:hypothetical protein